MTSVHLLFSLAVLEPKMHTQSVPSDTFNNVIVLWFEVDGWQKMGNKWSSNLHRDSTLGI